METHHLKAWPEYYQALYTGEKTFELRYDDRNFKVGDKLVIDEYDPDTSNYTGDKLTFYISYILKDAEKFGLIKDFVILGLKTEK